MWLSFGGKIWGSPNWDNFLLFVSMVHDNENEWDTFHLDKKMSMSYFIGQLRRDSFLRLLIYVSSAKASRKEREKVARRGGYGEDTLARLICLKVSIRVSMDFNVALEKWLGRWDGEGITWVDDGISIAHVVVQLLHCSELKDFRCNHLPLSIIFLIVASAEDDCWRRHPRLPTRRKCKRYCPGTCTHRKSYIALEYFLLMFLHSEKFQWSCLEWTQRIIVQDNVKIDTTLRNLLIFLSYFVSSPSEKVSKKRGKKNKEQEIVEAKRLLKVDVNRQSSIFKCEKQFNIENMSQMTIIH